MNVRFSVRHVAWPFFAHPVRVILKPASLYYIRVSKNSSHFRGRHIYSNCWFKAYRSSY